MMALVAATALGLTLDRWRATELGRLPTGASGNGIGASSWFHVLSFGRPSCYAVALTLVLIPLRWLRPRPAVSHVLRQPGAVACLAIIGTIVANISIVLLNAGINGWLRQPGSASTYFSNWYYWGQAVHSISMGVLGAWVALALGSRWSPEKSWIDRTGIALGIYWLAPFFLGFFHAIIEYLLPYKE